MVATYCENVKKHTNSECDKMFGFESYRRWYISGFSRGFHNVDETVGKFSQTTILETMDSTTTSDI
jgi:hypothetical protein